MRAPLQAAREGRTDGERENRAKGMGGQGRRVGERWENPGKDGEAMGRTGEKSGEAIGRTGSKLVPGSGRAGVPAGQREPARQPRGPCRVGRRRKGHGGRNLHPEDSELFIPFGLCLNGAWQRGSPGAPSGVVLPLSCRTGPVFPSEARVQRDHFLSGPTPPTPPHATTQHVEKETARSPHASCRLVPCAVWAGSRLLQCRTRRGCSGFPPGVSEAVRQPLAFPLEDLQKGFLALACAVTFRLVTKLKTKMGPRPSPPASVDGKDQKAGTPGRKPRRGAGSGLPLPCNVETALQEGPEPGPTTRAPREDI